MKNSLFPIVTIIVVFSIIFFLPLQYWSGFIWPIIDQDVEMERDGNFSVRTYVRHGEIIWSHYTWEDLGMDKGVTLEQLDSAKKANYKMAEEILTRYNIARKQ